MNNFFFKCSSFKNLLYLIIFIEKMKKLLKILKKKKIDVLLNVFMIK